MQQGFFFIGLSTKSGELFFNRRGVNAAHQPAYVLQLAADGLVFIETAVIFDGLAQVFRQFHLGEFAVRQFDKFLADVLQGVHVALALAFGRRQGQVVLVHFGRFVKRRDFAHGWQ